MTLRSEISTYFGKTVSGFVANKFMVEISAMNMSTLRFYVKKVSIPYETLNVSEDIYVSDVTLAKPRNITSVQTPSEISFAFRMDPENTIIKSLESLFASTHNIQTFEVTRSAKLFNITVTLYGTDHSVKYSKSFNNCSIIKMESYDLDASDRKLKEYSATFLCNRIDYSQYSSTGASVEVAINTSCQKLKDAYDAAKKKYTGVLNGQPSTAITTEVIDKALNESNIIPTYVNMLNNSKACRWDEKFPIGVDIPVAARTHLYNRLIKGGVPADHIQNGTA